MPHCRNCGHESHCGVPLYKDLQQTSELDDGHVEMKQTEVCKKCRCKKCEVKTDFG